MSEKRILNVEVVATLLQQRAKFLLVFNPRWGAFTFPMSKRKFFRDSAVSQAVTPEKLEHAAARVAAEVLGCSFRPKDFPRALVSIKGFEQSDADGVWKLYEFHVFGLKLRKEKRLVPGLIAEWMSPKEILSCEPVTRTARYLLQRLEEKGLLPA